MYVGLRRPQPYHMLWSHRRRIRSGCKRKMGIGVFGLISSRVSGAALCNPPSTFLSTFSTPRSSSPLPARPRLYQHSLEPLRVLIICHSVPPCRVISSDPHVPCTPHRYLSGYRCVARSPPLSDTHIPFPLFVRLQVRCVLSTSLRRASPPSTAIGLATAALHVLHLS